MVSSNVIWPTPISLLLTYTPYYMSCISSYMPYTQKPVFRSTYQLIEGKERSCLMGEQFVQSLFRTIYLYINDRRNKSCVTKRNCAEICPNTPNTNNNNLYLLFGDIKHCTNQNIQNVPKLVLDYTRCTHMWPYFSEK